MSQMHARRVPNPFAAGGGGRGSTSSRRVNYSDFRYNNGHQHQHRHRGRGSYCIGIVLFLLICVYSMYPSSQPYYYAYDSALLPPSASASASAPESASTSTTASASKSTRTADTLFEHRERKAPVSAAPVPVPVPERGQVLQVHASPSDGASGAAGVNINDKANDGIESADRHDGADASTDGDVDGDGDGGSDGDGDGDGDGGIDADVNLDSVDEPNNEPEVSADDDATNTNTKKGVQDSGDADADAEDVRPPPPHPSPVEIGQHQSDGKSKSKSAAKLPPTLMPPQNMSVADKSLISSHTTKSVGIISVDADTNTTLFLPRNSENTSFENQTTAVAVNSNLQNATALDGGAGANTTHTGNATTHAGTGTGTGTGSVAVNRTELVNTADSENQTESQIGILHSDSDSNMTKIIHTFNITHTSSATGATDETIRSNTSTIKNETLQNDDSAQFEHSNVTINNATPLVNATLLAPLNDETLHVPSGNVTSTIPFQNIASTTTTTTTTTTMDLLFNQTAPLAENVTSLVNKTTMNENKNATASATVALLEPKLPLKKNQEKSRGEDKAKAKVMEPEKIPTNNSTATNVTAVASNSNETLGGILDGSSDAVNSVNASGTGIVGPQRTTPTAEDKSTLALLETNSTMTANVKVNNVSATIINITAPSARADGLLNATNSSFPLAAKIGNLRGKKGRRTRRR